MKGWDLHPLHRCDLENKQNQSGHKAGSIETHTCHRNTGNTYSESIFEPQPHHSNFHVAWVTVILPSNVWAWLIVRFWNKADPMNLQKYSMEWHRRVVWAITVDHIALPNLASKKNYVGRKIHFMKNNVCREVREVSQGRLTQTLAQFE